MSLFLILLFVGSYFVCNAELFLNGSHVLRKRDIQLFTCPPEKPSICEGVHGKDCYGGNEMCDGKPDCIDGTDENSKTCDYNKKGDALNDFGKWKDEQKYTLFCRLTFPKELCVTPSQSFKNYDRSTFVWAFTKLKDYESGMMIINWYDTREELRKNVLTTNQVKAHSEYFFDLFWLLNYDTPYEIFTPYVAERSFDTLKDIQEAGVKDVITNLVRVLKGTMSNAVKYGILQSGS